MIRIWSWNDPPHDLKWSKSDPKSDPEMCPKKVANFAPKWDPETCQEMIEKGRSENDQKVIRNWFQKGPEIGPDFSPKMDP